MLNNALTAWLRLLSPRDKKVVLGLIGMAIVVPIFETGSIALLMAFISIATDVNYIHKNAYFHKLFIYSGCQTTASFVLALGLALLVFFALRAICNIIYIHASTRFAYSNFKTFSTKAFAHFLNFPYQALTTKNSSDISHVIFASTNMLTQVIISSLSLAAELFTITLIYAFLFVFNWKMTLALSGFLGGAAYLLIRFFAYNIKWAGKEAGLHTVQANRTYNETFGNYKLIKLLGSQSATTNRFASSMQKFASMQILFVFLQSCPRFMLETLGFYVLISLVLVFTYLYGTAQAIIPLVSLYALSFYRILPSYNKILMCINQISFSQYGLKTLTEFMQLPIETAAQAPITFTRELKLHNINFWFRSDKPILTNLSLTITKGQRIAFVGPSGSGKSTLTDIIMGLFTPTSGSVAIDNIPLATSNAGSWRQHIGYIPQTIYLFDGTVAENIVFGRAYNHERLLATLQTARLYDFIMAHDGLETNVGDGGVRLSGGQRQRLAIARALYGNPELLILDEATSALDHATEQEIMDEIYTLNRDVTIIIVAHRISTVQRCDVIYNIAHGSIAQVNFHDLRGFSNLQT